MQKLAMFAVAFVLLASSWQNYYSTGRLVVHETTDPNSAVCYDGLAENYAGQCVFPAAPSSQYVEKMADETIK